MLARAGIEIKHELSGVGENLQDHLQLRPVFKLAHARTLNVDYRSLVKRAGMALEYALFRRGPLTMAPSQLGIFTKSSDAYATPNLEFHVQPLSLDKFGDELHPFAAITLSVCNLRPTSRGSSSCRFARFSRAAEDLAQLSEHGARSAGRDRCFAPGAPALRSKGAQTL